MAGFIALLIVVGVISLFSCGPSEARLELRRERCNEIDLFFCNLYVVTWQYYQQLEPKIFEELIKYRPRQLSSFRNGFDFFDIVEKNAKKLYGESILDRCVKKAFWELRLRGYPVYRLNYDWNKRSDPEYAFVQLLPFETYDIEKDLYAFESKMRDPWDLYDWKAAKNAYGEFPTQCVPHFSDQRAYFFPEILKTLDTSYYIPNWGDLNSRERFDRTECSTDLKQILWDLERLEEGDSYH